MKELKRMIILDSNSILHRSFHALPFLTTRKGEPINAVYGFLLVLFKAIKEIQPDFICACFDFPALTFRHKEFKEYKATRPPTPKDLISQIPKVKEVLKAFSVPVFEKEGFEADDLIATIAKKAKDEVSEIFVLTGDFDTLQIVDKKIKIFFLGKKMKEPLIYDEKKIISEFGILPRQIPDFKALVGDQSDNIPRVPTVGEKTALKLVGDFGTIENLFVELEKNSDRVKKMKLKLRETLIQKKEQVFLSKMLAKTKEDVPIEFNLKNCQWGNFDREKIIRTFQDFQFFSLIKRLSEIFKKEQKNLSLW
jgi:DNA polymerase-1